MEQKVTAILEYWCLHYSPLTSEQRQVFESHRPGLLPGIVTGQVVRDSKGRWEPGACMRSSLVASYDFQAGLVYTANSCYQLRGAGMIRYENPPADYAEAVAITCLYISMGRRDADIEAAAE